MGRASSNKKVSRAAGTGGGRTAGGRIAWGYYGVIAVVVVLGIVGTVVSRNRYHDSLNSPASTPPAIGTTWNEGYSIDVCGKVLPNITVTRDPDGIRTQGDGIIHIDPRTKAAAGKNATLGTFAGVVGMKLNAGELQVPGGALHRSGDLCNGKKSAVYVKQFAFVGATAGSIVSGKTDPRDVRLQDQALVTIAFVPIGQTNAIPAPPKAVQDALTKLAASTSTSTTTTAPSTSTTTGSGATTTTVPASSTTATTATPAPTAAPATTATTAAPATTATTAAPATTPTTAAP